MLQLHYAIEFQEINRKILRTNVKGTISLFLGALLFFIFGILEWYKVNFIFKASLKFFHGYLFGRHVIPLPLRIQRID